VENNFIDTNGKKEYIHHLLEQFFKICGRRGYSKKQIAELAGVHFTAIFRWARGESLPVSKSVIERIENYLKQNSVQLCHNSDKVSLQQSSSEPEIKIS